MSETAIGINLGIAAAGLAICILGFVQAHIDHGLGKKRRRYLIIIFALLILYVSSDLLGQITDDYTGSLAVGASRVLLFVESASSAFATTVLLAFVLDSSGKDWRRSGIMRLAAVLWFAYVAMLVVAQFTDFFYEIDANNVYRRGPLYPVLLAPPAIIMILGLVTLWRERAKLSGRQRAAFLTCFTVPAVSMMFQMAFYGIYAVVFGTVISAFVLLMFIQADHSQRYYLTLAENARLKSDIMLSQLQPHFLCNALGAIGRMSEKDPKATKDAIGTFSRYLRENIESLSDDAPAPFSREFEHVKAYLALEKLRFGDELNVEYDIQCTDFFLPTLALQPLVENAVRHGVRGSESGVGTVVLSSREYDDRWEAVVADDGAGFDPQAPLPEDGRTHVGLANVQERLKISCNGSLCIESSPGCGCRATIVVPKNPEEGASS